MDQKKYLRDLQKKKIQRIQLYVQDNPPLPEDTGSNELASVYKLKQEMLQEAFDEFTVIQNKIRLSLDITNEDEVRQFEESLFETQDMYIEVRAKLEAYRLLIATAQANEHSFMERLTQELQNSTVTEKNFSLTPFLQPLKIPTFDGQYTEWSSFNDTFTSAVIKNRSLSNSQKLQHLKESLKGEAAQIIRHISVTDANFDLAWELLTKRFDKKNYIVQSLIKSFMTQPKCQGTSVQIRNLHSTSQEVLLSLKALGPLHELRDPWLIYVLCDKLDQETLQLWADKLTTLNEPNVHDLLDVIETRSEALEIFPISDVHLVTKSSSEDITKSNKKTSNNSYTDSCMYCTNGKHSLVNCFDFRDTSIDARNKFVSDNNLCSNCLWSEHDTEGCRSLSRCTICHNKHNTLLHTESTTSKESSSFWSTTSPTPSESSDTTASSSTTDCCFSQPPL